MSETNRRKVFALALRSKLFSLAPLALLAAIAAYFVSPSFRLESALTAIGATAFGLSSAWYFIGTGAPFKLFRLDALPRLLGVALSAIAMIGGVGLGVYPLVGLILPSLMAPLLASLSVKLRRADWDFARRIGNPQILRSQWHAVVARSASSLYISLPAGIVAIVAPQALVMFSAADRLQRMFLSVLSAVPNALQGWVGKPETRDGRIARARTAILMNAGFGIVAGGIFVLASPVASKLIFSGVATIPYDLALLCGVLIAVVCTSRATGNLGLVAARRIGYVAVSAIAGSLVGLPMILILSAYAGAAGAITGAIIAELTVLMVQVFGLIRPGRKR